jgi:hypothetical protein
VSTDANTTARPKQASRVRRFFRGCALGCLLPTVILVITLWITVALLAQPGLNTKKASRVDVTLYQEREPYTNYLGAITNSVQVRKLLDVLADSSGAFGHKCKASGWFTVSYRNGETRRIEILQGHGSDTYEYRHGWFVRVMDRTEFLQALSNGGIATNSFVRLEE